MNLHTHIQRKHIGMAEQAAAPQFAHAALRASGQPLATGVQIQHLAPAPLFQPKLTIGAPNDIYEQEAERVADQVMRMPTPSAAIQRAPIGIQRCGKCAAATRIEDMCPSCAAKATASLAATDRKGISHTPTTIHRAPSGATPEVTPQIEANINALRGGGQPLDGGVRAFMEPRFGHDFSHVRVHTGAPAAQSAASVQALAYTVGHDVVFGAGQYQPGTSEGKRLIAHELTHVIQQGVEIYPKALARQTDGSQSNTCKHPGFRRTIRLQPVFFKSEPSDNAPTGHTFHRRLGPANRIWGKVGVHFTHVAPIVVIDSIKKTSGNDEDEALNVASTHTGFGIEVFFVDNKMEWAGGGATASNGASAKIVLADHGANHHLLAHEIGHALGLGHPEDGEAESNTIMEPSGSLDQANPSRNTMDNYGRINSSWASDKRACLFPDP